MGTEDHSRLLQWLSIRIKYDQHLLLLLLTLFLAFALIAIAPNIDRCLVEDGWLSGVVQA